MPKEEKKKSWKETQRERQTEQQRTQQAYQAQRERDEKKKPRKSSLNKLFLGVALIVLMLTAYGTWQYYEGQKSAPIATGGVNPSPIGSAPNFSLKDINGTRVSLNQFKGKVIAVHFMALAGCSGQLYPINDNQLQQLRTVCGKYCGKGQVALVTVSVASCQGCDTILAQIRDYYNISWVLGNDYDDEKLDIIDSYADYSIYDGTIVLIDQAFNVAQVYTDTITADLLSSKIGQLLQVA